MTSNVAFNSPSYIKNGTAVLLFALILPEDKFQVAVYPVGAVLSNWLQSATSVTLP